MLADQTLSNFSDLMFRTTFVVYVIALVVAMVFYVKIQTVIDARKQRAERERSDVETKQMASTSAAMSASANGSSSVAVSESPSDHRGDAAGEASIAGEASTAGDDISDERLQEIESKTAKWSGMAHTLIWLGIIIHAGATLTRALATGRFPFGNMYEYALVLTLLTMLVAAIVITQRKEWRVLWPWLTVPVLALMFFGGSHLYAEAAPVVPALRSFWLPIHVGIASLGGAIGMFSGVCSLLYLLRRWKPKGQERGGIGAAIVKPLPNAKKLDGLAYKSAIVALPVLGLGIVLGAVWAEAAWGRPWGWDPKETVSFISWILYAAYLHARATAGWRDMKAAWINIVALATTIFNFFFINMVVSGLHSYAGLN